MILILIILSYHPSLFVYTLSKIHSLTTIDNNILIKKTTDNNINYFLIKTKVY